jgi:hypothetical protein
MHRPGLMLPNSEVEADVALAAPRSAPPGGARGCRCGWGRSGEPLCNDPVQFIDRS